MELSSNSADERSAALSEVFLKSNEGRVVEFLFEMLRDEEAAAKAEEVFSARSDAPFLRALARIYRARREPILARRLACLRSLPWAVGAQLPAALAGMTGEDILGLIVFVLLSGIPVAEKTRSMERLSASPCAVVRETGQSVLRSLGTGLTSQEVASRLLQAAERARASAAAETPAGGEPRTAEGYTVGRLLEEAGKLGGADRERIARKLADIDPKARAKLSAALRSGEADRRLGALSVIAPMGFQEGMLDDILKLAMSDDNRVRATAVKLLGGFKNRESVRALLEAILDMDRRVVANAVEGLGETGMRVLANVVVPLLKHPSGRVRANAVRALWMLGYPKVAAVLRDMAEDRDEAMRLSALWTMGEIDHPESRRLLKELAASDPSDRVRSKAAEILEGLPR